MQDPCVKIAIITYALLSVLPLQAQTIIGVLGEYVLINSHDIGRVGDEVQIQRNLGGGIVTVGIVKLSKFKDGRATAKIIKEIPPYKIQVKDFLQRARIQGKPEKEPVSAEAQGAVEAQYGAMQADIIFVESGFVLIDTVFATAALNQLFLVQRQSAQQVIEVGTVRLLKPRGKGTIGEIVEQYGSHAVSEGDYITGILVRTGEESRPSPAELTPHRILQRKDDYVLFPGGEELGELGGIVHIERRSEVNTLEIATAELLELKDGKAIARIISELDKYQVRAGDVVITAPKESKSEASTVDIDFYFFGNYKREKEKE